MQIWFKTSHREDCVPSAGRLVDLLTKGMFYESALQLCYQKVAPGGCANISDSLTDNLLQVLLCW